MKTRQRNSFLSVRTEGALLPADLLERIAAGDREITGLAPADYHLAGRERLAEAANRAWNACRAAWAAFGRERERLGEGGASTGLTREYWLLPLFAELGYGRLLPVRGGLAVGEKAYPISHAWHRSPIHLVGCGVDLDKRTAGVAGAARSSPYSLVQEFLNRSDEHLWGFVSNGLCLRILRDNASLVRQAYVEFDLQAIMDGELYADFVLLWLLCHQSRVEAERPADCWLERWTQEGQRVGTRLRDRLRDGVETAIGHLGSGFLAHPANETLRRQLRDGELDRQEYYRQLLRMVYRLLFLFVAEDRGLLLDPAAEAATRERYTAYYSSARLRTLAGRRVGTAHHDLYQGLRLVIEALSSDGGCPPLALPALGGLLFSPAACPALQDCEIANMHLLAAVRALAYTEEGKVRVPVDYRNLGTEELGSIYEALLELHPELQLEAASFTLRRATGNERKSTGSYYTNAGLISALLDTALDPVLAEAARKPSPEAAVLALKVCDPACGSGHFLIAAANRMAKKLASLRTGDEESAPDAVRSARRDVIGHCIFGVDANPMAVELCKVSLWLEALDPGKPLSFLDGHIQCGNSLLGATPALLDGGIPDAAFTPIEGDERAYCAEWRKRNAQERKGLLPLRPADAPWERLGDLAAAMAGLDALDDSSIAGIHAKEDRYAALVASAGYRSGRLRADAWCAAFVWPKRPAVLDPRTGQTRPLDYPITESVYRAIERSPYDLAPWMYEEIRRLAGPDGYNVLHWHLAFPTVFRLPAPSERPDNPRTGWSGGFDVVIGNPPWDRIKLQEKEWFAAHGRSDIANAANAVQRKRLIAMLSSIDPVLWSDWCASSRKAEGQSHFVRQSGRYPLCGKGDVNTYTLFAEHNRNVLGSTGRAGFIVPTGIATDDTTKEYFFDLMTRKNLAAFYGFENEAKLFKDIDHRVNFCLLVLSSRETPAPNFSAFVRDPSFLRDHDRVYQLTETDIVLLNPNTRTCPVFRTRRDADLNLGLYRRTSVLWRENDPEGNPWSLRFMSMFHMANDSRLFYTRAMLEADGYVSGGMRHKGRDGIRLPLFEAKMVYHFNHRFGDFALLDPGEREHILPQVPDSRLSDPYYFNSPRYWVDAKEVIPRISQFWSAEWFLGWRDVTDPRSSVRTVVACIIPNAGVSGKFPLLLSPRQDLWLLYANLCSFVLDYAGRQKIGGVSLSMFVMKQLPILPPTIYARNTPWLPGTILYSWILDRVLELTYTAWDLERFAQDCGWYSPPFRWDAGRRFLLRCELDATFFHLYLPAENNGDWRQAEGETPEELARLKASFPTPRDAVAYIMDTFPIVRHRDEEKFNGDYRTKRVILEIYDALAESIRTSRPYQTRLNPPPADPRCCHAPNDHALHTTE